MSFFVSIVYFPIHLVLLQSVFYGFITDKEILLSVDNDVSCSIKFTDFDYEDNITSIVLLVMVI